MEICIEDGQVELLKALSLKRDYILAKVQAVY